MNHEDMIEKTWMERYARLKFTADEIKFYETLPMGERQKSAVWKLMDFQIFADLKQSTQVRSKSTSAEIITDSMEPQFCHADGKYYSSKHKLQEGLKAADSHVIEKGEHDYTKRTHTLKGDYGVKKDGSLKRAIDQHLKH